YCLFQRGESFALTRCQSWFRNSNSNGFGRWSAPNHETVTHREFVAGKCWCCRGCAAGVVGSKPVADDWLKPSSKIGRSFDRRSRTGFHRLSFARKRFAFRVGPRLASVSHWPEPILEERTSSWQRKPRLAPNAKAAGGRRSGLVDRA